MNQNFSNFNNQQSQNNAKKNLNLLLPSMDNSYFANHINDVLNPILDDTANYSFYNIHNENDISNEFEQSADYETKIMADKNLHFPNYFNLNKNLAPINSKINQGNNPNNNKMFMNNKHTQMELNIQGNAYQAKGSFNQMQNMHYSNEQADFYNPMSTFQNFPEDQNIMDENTFKNLKDEENNYMPTKPYMQPMNSLSEDFTLNNPLNNQMWINDPYNNPNNIIRNNLDRNNRNKKNFVQNNDIIYPQNYLQGEYVQDSFQNVYMNNASNKYTESPYGRMNIGLENNSANLSGQISNFNLQNRYVSQNFNGMKNQGLGQSPGNLAKIMNNPNFINNMNTPNTFFSVANANMLMNNPQKNANNNCNRNTSTVISAKGKSIKGPKQSNNLPNEGGSVALQNMNNKMLRTSPSVNVHMGNVMGQVDNNNNNSNMNYHDNLNSKLNKFISNYSDFSDEDLARNALLISKDQCGCRFIQKKISENAVFTNNCLYPRVCAFL